MGAPNQLSYLKFKKSPGTTPSNVADLLFELQFQQLKHDEKFHKEIVSLTVHQKINHMALHFAKYTGQITQFCSEDSPRPEAIQQTLVDSFVICLICANMFNVRLSDHIEEIETKRPKTFLELEKAVALSQKDGLRGLLQSIAIWNGKLARACEKMDHLERFPYREEMVSCVIQIFKSILGCAGKMNIDLSVGIRNRWEEIEKRSIFYNSL